MTSSRNRPIVVAAYPCKSLVAVWRIGLRERSRYMALISHITV